MDDATTSSGTRDETVRLPMKKPAQAVVRCKGFRCTAYVDKNGAWRSVADDAELEVLEVIMRF